MTSKELKRVEDMVRNLIERLRASFGARCGAQPDHLEYFFMTTCGDLSITGDDAIAYRECRDAIIRLHGTNSERRVLSRRTAERLLTDTLARALRPGLSGYQDPRSRFEGRVKRELRRLKHGLTAQNRTWHFAVEVTGLHEHALPLTLGRVRFVRGTRHTGSRIASNIFNLQPGTPRIGMKKRLAENGVREKSRSEVAAMFAANAVALVEIAAADHGAAQELGITEVRRTVDVLNFFPTYFEHPVGLHLAYVAPEGRGTKLRWAVYDPSTWAFSYLDGAANEWAITAVRTRSKVARRVGLIRVNELLARETRTDLEDRIVTAVAWAGRARTERRREQSFLLYAIALEALFTKPGARAGVTDRLRLRVAYLVHQKLEPRRTLAKTMERLYQLRSSLVHAGSADELADEDLKIIDRIVELALVTMLTKAPFKDMRTAADFERWFDDRLLGG